MSGFEHFHFLRPWWLAALVPLAVLLFLVATRRVGSRGWEAVCDAGLLPHILIGHGTGQDRRALILAGICGLAAVLALAGPAWERLPQPVFRTGSALVIALDLSRSMDATDVSPTRVERARFKISDILRSRREGQTALVAYAGDAFTVAPLTDDRATIESQLAALSTNIMPAQGNRTDLALKLAGELLRGASAPRGEILLITDEVAGDRTREAARDLVDDGYRVSVLGVGTEHGVPIPLADGSFLKDESGKIVIPSLDEKPMRELSEIGRGTYVRLTLDDADVSRLSAVFSDRPTSDHATATQLKTDVWREEGPWLVLALLPVAALAFRRGYLFALLFLLMPLPRPAQALDWQALWWRPDQRAMQALDHGDAERAAKLFDRRDWKGAARYRAKDYAGAAESLAPLEEVESIYNHGNALARLGRYEEAIAAYEKVLSEDPNHEDARFNKELLEKELQRQQQQQQQSGTGAGEPGRPGSGDRSDDGTGGGDQAGQQGQESQEPGASDRRRAATEGERDRAQPGEQNAHAEREAQAKADAGTGQRERPAQESLNEEAQAGDGGDAQEDGRLARAPSPDTVTADEEQQATEQWLRRIPDDPGGLLRRKFRYQYQQRRRLQSGEEGGW